MKKKNKRLTPLEKLCQEKHELLLRCEEEQIHLVSDWGYIREHSGSLILSGVSKIFYPHRHKKAEDTGEKESFWHNIQDNLPFYLSIARESLSILWYIGRPFYFKWAASHRKRKKTC